MKLEELMNQYYETLSANEKYICESILNHKNDCIKLSIDEFACKYHVSTSALSRFAQKLKLPGYSELRTMLRLNDSLSINDSQNVEHMMNCYKGVIDYIDQKDCMSLFEKMSQVNRIIVFGEGYTQGRAAKEMKRIFLPLGIQIYDIYGYDMIESLKTFVQPDDMIFFISFHGNAQEVIDLAIFMKMKGIYTVSMTKMVSNKLSQICDENLYIQSLSLPIDHNRNYEITTPYFILIELLFIKYKMYNEM
ncbi:MurR/RpiR family transcriptional regulator [Candidatus Stoquefichus sp. SB1]|uniref:MurR/RpiR family transcriptional regulator n=1 Tax=Candidatus Stoquefichus sp. SB1 TaxID=1658109 RepID=UPI00067EE15D|nr:MurR/RpiR family transcriptional regulator [Candidatus Stoquefichus sp. SB1]